MAEPFISPSIGQTITETETNCFMSQMNENRMMAECSQGTDIAGTKILFPMGPQKTNGGRISKKSNVIDF